MQTHLGNYALHTSCPRCDGKIPRLSREMAVQNSTMVLCAECGGKVDFGKAQSQTGEPDIDDILARLDRDLARRAGVQRG